MSLYGGENWKSVATNIALSSEFITKMKINDNWKKSFHWDCRKVDALQKSKLLASDGQIDFQWGY